MKGSGKQIALAGCLVILAGVGCAKPKPIQPKNPVPPGTVLYQFTKKVEGPVELTVDGQRIPVEQPRKKGKFLTISGLSLGKHHLVLLSPLDVFGPDQMDVELGPLKGEFKVLFSQQIKSVLYGQPEPAPAAQGLPGVKAVLLP